jgi:hypothetical protein
MFLSMLSDDLTFFGFKIKTEIDLGVRPKVIKNGEETNNQNNLQFSLDS